MAVSVATTRPVGVRDLRDQARYIKAMVAKAANIGFIFAIRCIYGAQEAAGRSRLPGNKVPNCVARAELGMSSGYDVFTCIYTYSLGYIGERLRNVRSSRLMKDVRQVLLS